MSVYERIENLRKAHGISQGKLEKELGFSNGSISKWKTSTPTSDRLKKIADYFGVSINFLLTGENDEPSDIYYTDPETAKAAQEMFENKELRALFDVQRDMSASDLRTIYDIVLALKRKERGNEDDTGV